jgi:aryl-alcohol dehydrogenase-like predicted oxidoreductase
MRVLGATALPVSRIGLGLAALGRPSYINLGRAADLPADRSVNALERRCHAVLDAAYAAGIRYFDAARSYGLAEAFLGRWLRARDRSRTAVTVGSKWGYTYTADWK